MKDAAKALAKLGRSCFIPYVATSIPSSALENFIVGVWNLHAGRLGLGIPRGAGAEVWSQRLDVGAGDYVPWHSDKDEAAFAVDPDNPKHPIISSVTYLNDSDEMATVVFGENNTLVCFGRKGQHLAFDGRMLHGVVPVGKGGREDGADGEASGQRNKRRRKRRRRRLTLLVNLWLEPPSRQDFVAPPTGEGGENGGENIDFEKAPWDEIPVSHPLMTQDNDNPDEIIAQVTSRSDICTCLLVEAET